ncbi:coatomer subunit beta-like [Dysidea avara]|uniref:coatomer subunit beta-like n=1 Tax=Dysidea avara TaxID=196820 RepID=UPI0033277C83
MSTFAEQPCYTLINTFDDTSEVPNEQQLKHDLEHGTIAVKTSTLKKVIQLILQGEKYPGLLMTIIRFLLPNSDHTLKKLLLIFWEIVPKTTSDGKLLQEMILVCDAYRKDLQHPNEFIRGSTLRFLCKLKEPELLEPLMPSIRACLDYKHAYVRRNAVLAIYTIYKNFDQLIPDAPELILNYLEGEQDASCKRNAFMMLTHVDRERALDYLSTCIDQVHTFNDILQLVIVELVYKVCHSNPSERSRFIRCIYNLLSSGSLAVRYEAAGTLVTLSNAPSAIKAAAQCYVELIIKESDNNVKLIVLDRLINLKNTSPTHDKILQELVMDILRVLGSPDLEVRRKTLSLVLQLTSTRNVEQVVMVMKKELTSTMETSSDTSDVKSYRQNLVKTLHSCSIKFPDMAVTVVPLLLEFVSDDDEVTAEDVLTFVREAIQKYPHLKSTVINKLLEVFSHTKSANVHRGMLWILGEYCTSVEEIMRVILEVRTTLGEIPIVDAEIRKQAGEATEEENLSPTSTPRQLVTADGTYATQSVFSSANTGSKKEEHIPALRAHLLNGDFFVGSSLATSLVKMVTRYSSHVTEEQSRNVFAAEAMLMIASILHLGRSGIPKKPITEDDAERMSLCLRVLSSQSDLMIDVFGDQSRNALANMLAANDNKDGDEGSSQYEEVTVEVDQGIVFPLLTSGTSDADVGENKFDSSLLQATGHVVGGHGDGQSDYQSKLKKVIQLSGFSDPVYVEAYVHINQYDIVLDVLVVNQTSDTLQGLSLELATLGDLKLVEKPQPCILGPYDFTNIKANIKVSSTENGIIFGNIVYDIVGSTADRNCVVLSNIHIDIMDYIVPATCSDVEFRKMWAEFEWENKINVNTNITDLHDYLNHLLSITNMKCLTPDKALTGECGFLAANLYAHSIFGEDALANLSIEKPLGSAPNEPVLGHVRIRAKTQGMALSLGDKIQLSQKLPAS